MEIEAEKDKLIKETIELENIFGAILRKLE